MPPSLARSSGAPSRIVGNIRLVAAWSDTNHSTHHASQRQHHTNVQQLLASTRLVMLVVVGRSSTLLIHKNHDKSSSKRGTRYSTSYQSTPPHAHYSMRYDEEIVMQSDCRVSLVTNPCTFVATGLQKKHCTLIIHAHLML